MRTLVAIDTNNLYHCIRHQYDDKLNYKELMDFLIDSYQVTRVKAYGLETQGDDKFADLLSILKYDTCFVPMKNPHQTVLVYMAVDIIRMSPRIDKLVLCSSDISFKPLVEYLNDSGIEVEILACGIPNILKNLVNKSIEIQPDLVGVENEHGEMP
jgi:uncharacterized LabA/DUF88 family protein